MRAGAVGAAAASLVVVPTALGHGSVQPTVAAPGATQRFTFVVLNGPAEGMVGFRLELPSGASIVQAEAQSGWRATSGGRGVEWHGGPIPPGGAGSFALRARMPAVERTVSFTGREVFPDEVGPPFRLDVVLAGDAPTGAVTDEGARTLGTAVLLVAIAALLLAAAGIVLGLARRRRAA